MDRMIMVKWEDDLMYGAVADMEIPGGIPLPEPVEFEYRKECGKRTDNFYAEIYDRTYAEISAEKEKRARKFQRTHNECGKMKDARKSYECRKSYKQDIYCGINHIKHMRNSSAEKSIREDYMRNLIDAANEKEALIDAESFAESLIQSAINTLYADDSEWSIDYAEDEIREAVNQKNIAEYLRAGLEI